MWYYKPHPVRSFLLRNTPPTPQKRGGQGFSRAAEPRREEGRGIKAISNMKIRKQTKLLMNRNRNL
jgi:hypothetical protein